MSSAETATNQDKGGYDLAQEETGLPRGTLHSMVHKHQIPHTRLGKRLVRFSRKSLREWMKARTITPDHDSGNGSAA